MSTIPLNPLHRETAPNEVVDEALLDEQFFHRQRVRGLKVVASVLGAVAFLYGALWLNYGEPIPGWITLAGTTYALLLTFRLQDVSPAVVTLIFRVSMTVCSLQYFTNALYLWHHTSISASFFVITPIIALMYLGRPSAIFHAIEGLVLLIATPFLVTYFQIQANLPAPNPSVFNILGVCNVTLIVLVTVFLMDTQAKARHRFIRKQRDQLRITQAELIETQQYRNRFFASMSHEIRTPMNAINGIADLLKDKKTLPSEDMQLIHLLGRSSTHLLNLINDLLDLSKLDENKVTILMSDCDLRELVYESLSIVRYAATGKNLETQLEVDAQLPKYFVTDANRLRQILVNLLNNAVKFTEQGKVSIHVTMQSGENAQADSILFTIKDTGVGIPQEMQERIFTGYVQADQYVASKFGGTGLGLHISRRLVLLMNGDITVKSEVGVGSEFTIQLPLIHSKLETATHLGDDFSEDSALTVFTETPIRILIVEDNQLNIMIAKRLISRELHHCHITVAEDGQKALDYLHSADEASLPDMILMDLQMPVMGGLECTRHIRTFNNARIAAVPIIAMTANASNEDKQQCMDAGMDDFVSKPLDVQFLLHKMMHIMNQR